MGVKCTRGLKSVGSARLEEETAVGRHGISIGKQKAVGSLARKMNKIMKEGKIWRVDDAAEEKKEASRESCTVSRLTARGWNVLEERAHESPRGCYCSFYDLPTTCVNHRPANFRLPFPFFLFSSCVLRVYPVVVVVVVIVVVFLSN